MTENPGHDPRFDFAIMAMTRAFANVHPRITGQTRRIVSTSVDITGLTCANTGRTMTP